MEWITPITNRTLADVEAVKSLKERIYAVGWKGLTAAERAEFLGDAIGTLNHITLNRIECNINHMEDVIRNLGFIMKKQTYKQDWDLYDLPDQADFERLLGNIVELLDTFYYMGTSLPDNLLQPDFEQLNAVEEVLHELKKASDLVIRSWKHCGSFVCGQSLILPQRS